MRRFLVGVVAALMVVPVSLSGVAQASGPTVTFDPRTSFPTGNDPYSVVVGDLNGDGFPDMATANSLSNNVSVLLGDGSGGFGPKTDFATGARPSGLAIADLDGDTRPRPRSGEFQLEFGVGAAAGVGRRVRPNAS